MSSGVELTAPEAVVVEEQQPSNSKQSPKNTDVTKEDVNTVSFFSLFRYADKVDYLLMLLGTIGALAAGLGMPSLTIVFGDLLNGVNDLATAIDDEEQDERLSDLTSDISGTAAIAVYIGLAVWVACFFEISMWQMAAVRQGNRIRQHFLRAVMQQEVAYFDAEASQAQLLSGLNESTTQVQQGTGEKVGQTLHHITTFVAGIVVGLVYGWKMALVVMATLPFIVVAGAVFAKVQAWANAKNTKAYATANGVAVQNVQNVRTVVSYTAEEAAVRLYDQQLAEPTRIAKFSGAASGGLTGLVNGFFFWAYAIALWAGAKFIRDGFVTNDDGQEVAGDFNGGDAMTVLFAIIIGSFSLGQAAPNFEFFARARVAGYQIFSLLERTPEISLDEPGVMVEHTLSVLGTQGTRSTVSAPSRDALTVQVDTSSRVVSLRGEITFDAVRFAYPIRPDRDVLGGLSLKIPAGKTVALVGSSGSGKSTVVQLLQRFYDPREGAIRVDGIDLKDFNLRSLRGAMGLVSQEPTLFATTIRENIAFGRQGATQEEIEVAAKAANAHNFIQQMPQGYNTWAGEAGVQLSGGQKQRIAIARAILKNPPILMLDEATSALDSQSERLVQAAIDDMIAGSSRTTIVIAHRLSTVRNADVIAVMQDGQLVEQGSHSDLVANPSGAYSTLIKLQQAAQESEEQEEGEAVDQDAPEQIVTSQKSTATPGKSSKIVYTAKGIATDAEGKQLDLADVPEKQLKSPGIMRLLKYNRPEWHLLVLGVLLSIIVGCVFPAFAFVLAELINTLFNPNRAEQKEDASQWSLIITLMGVAYVPLTLVQQICFAIMGVNLTRRLRVLMFRSILYQDIGWFDREDNSSGILTAQLESSCGIVRGAVGDTLGLAVQNMATMFCGFIIGFVLDWAMTLVVLAVIPFTVLGMVIEFSFYAGGASNSSEAYAKANSTVLEALMSIRVVHSYLLEDTVLDTYKTHLEAPFRTNMRRANIAGTAFGYSQFMQFVNFGLAFWFGSVRLDQNAISFDEILKVFFAIFFAAMGASQAQMLFPNVAGAVPAAKRVFQVIDRQPAIDSKSKAGATPSNFSGDIEFQRVKFSYPSRPDIVVLNHFSLRVHAGKKVALVGESGSGKSTVVSLLERFYDVSSGLVLLDGKDIRTLQVAWLRSQFGLVSQEPVLFSASVTDNVKYGKPDATQDEVDAALRAANATEFVSQLSEGSSTMLGELGVRLSGGQKQRIAIARAIIRNPKVLLLDEATSALDASSEREVQMALDAVMEGRTTVAIAHRLSTIRNFDKIAVLQRGVLLEVGTHDELMRIADGNYLQLVNHQMAH